jgi:hypothetical protein
VVERPWQPFPSPLLRPRLLRPRRNNAAICRCNICKETRLGIERAQNTFNRHQNRSSNKDPFCNILPSIPLPLSSSRHRHRNPHSRRPHQKFQRDPRFFPFCDLDLSIRKPRISPESSALLTQFAHSNVGSGEITYKTWCICRRKWRGRLVSHAERSSDVTSELTKTA